MPSRHESPAPPEQRQGGGVPPPAARAETGDATRATPEEIARALAAIEARRVGFGGDGTVPIAEVVRELGGNLSADEVRAEVEAERRRVADLAASSARRARGRRAAGWRAALLLGGVVCLIAGARLVGVGREERAEAVVRTALPPVLRDPRTVARYGEAFESDSYLARLSEVPDGSTVRVGLTVGRCGDAPCLGIRDADAAAIGGYDCDWPVVKHGGRLYLRAYTEPASEAALTGRTVHLYRDENGGPVVSGGRATMRVTVRLDTIQPAPEMSELEGRVGMWLKVADMRPDKHLREGWTWAYPPPEANSYPAP